ncbi:hypothetical protein [Pseudomonas sp.]|uniref:hypothetical protein n=1 Tax=Pseudomonas sp. TaxID=306 RepID=UPI003FD7A9C8
MAKPFEFVFSEKHNVLILDRFNSNANLAERFGCNVRTIQRQRQKLKANAARS